MEKYMKPLLMCSPKPSMINAAPIMTRKAKASTFTVACSFTKSAMGPLAKSMRSTAMITARDMISNWLLMPTAVITESKLKTMSIKMICNTTLSMLVALR